MLLIKEFFNCSISDYSAWLVRADGPEARGGGLVLQNARLWP